ncbi:MAG: asparagine synthase (glutamine-hydrolyzing) [Mycobacteriales bacterium]
MCGLVVVATPNGDEHFVRAALRRAADVQAHRGPDSQGATAERLRGGLVVGIAAQRLAIVDLSPSGYQPMVSPDGRYVLAYNGEVYNFAELWAELASVHKGDAFPGDTRVVLSAFESWGPAAFGRFNGMWALAILDRQQERIILARDRMGQKPLYLHRNRDTLVVASEVKSVLAATGERLYVDVESVARYLAQSLVSTCDATFFDGIRSLPPGTWLEVDCHGGQLRLGRPRQYWRHPFEAQEATPVGLYDAVEQVRCTFLDSVKLRLRSDVPVGLLLSGGVDSSSIAMAARQADGAGSLVALSIGSGDPRFDETRFAEMVAHQAGLSMHTVRVDDDPVALCDDIAETCWFNDQPFSSMSIVAHRRLMGVARDLGIVVLLSGQGADEQLAGYNKFFYFYLHHCWRQHRGQEALRLLLDAVHQRTVLREFKLAEAKRYLSRIQRSRGERIMGNHLTGSLLADVGPAGSYEEREWRDMTSLSVPALLHYEDRMAMSHSREIRCPFMDYRLIEILAQVPPRAKLAGGWTKAVFREAMAGILPEEIRWRRDKNGFGLPEDRWMRSILLPRLKSSVVSREFYAADLGLVNQREAVRLIDGYERGSPLVSFKDVFSLYCLEQWLRRFEPFVRPFR